MTLITQIINRPGVAGVVLQTPLSLIKSVTDAFPPNLQNIRTPKHLEIEGSNFDTIFIIFCVSRWVYPVYPYA